MRMPRLSRPSKTERILMALAGGVALTLAAGQTVASKESDPRPALPAQIQAQYDISLAGFNLGTFDFEQQSAGGTYSVKSVVELSALLGAFEWRGITHTSGKYGRTMVQPEHYAFDYRSKSNGGLIRMDFENGDVKTVTAFPNGREGPNHVPLQRVHTKNVLDPLTAILSIVQVSEKQVCGRQIAIFDGKQRFNLKLNFRRKEVLPPLRPGLAPRRGTVCQIRYNPVAGYTPSGQTQAFAAEKNIEIAFHSLPSADVMVPYRISLPTMVGTAQLDLKRLSVRPARDRIAAMR